MARPPMRITSWVVAGMSFYGFLFSRSGDCILPDLALPRKCPTSATTRPSRRWGWVVRSDVRHPNRFVTGPGVRATVPASLTAIGPLCLEGQQTIEEGAVFAKSLTEIFRGDLCSTVPLVLEVGPLCC